MVCQNSSANSGGYLFTSSLGNIIGVEKENMKEREKVKCISIQQKILYGNL